jgi:hypothetical protein
MFLGSSSLFAEGSVNLCANGGTRPRLEFRDDTTSGIRRYTVIKVYVNSGETLYLGSSAQGIGNGTIVARRPDNTTVTSGNSTMTGFIQNRTQEVAGPLPNTNGYAPLTVTVNQTGVWEIEFRCPLSTTTGADPGLLSATVDWPAQTATDRFVNAWDVTVRNASGQRILGRAYTNSIALMMGAAGSAFNSNLYVLTEEGYQYRYSGNGLDPYGFILFASNRGILDPLTREPAYESLDFLVAVPDRLHDPNIEDSWAHVTHKLFFSAPNTDLPQAAIAPAGSGGQTWLLRAPQLPPTAQSFAFVGVEGTPGRAGTNPLGGYFTFESAKLCSYTITIDVNRDGVYGPRPDRILSGIAMAQPAVNQVYWDGLNAYGVAVPASTTGYSVQV